MLSANGSPWCEALKLPSHGANLAGCWLSDGMGGLQKESLTDKRILTSCTWLIC